MKKSFCWAIWEGKRRLSAWNLHLETLSCPTCPTEQTNAGSVHSSLGGFYRKSSALISLWSGEFHTGFSRAGTGCDRSRAADLHILQSFWNCPLFRVELPLFPGQVSTLVPRCPFVFHLCPSPNVLFSWFYGLGAGRIHFKFPWGKKKNSTVLNFSLRSVAVNSWFICQTSFNSITEEKKHLSGAGTENNYLFSSTHEVFIIKSSSSVYSKQQKCQWIL